MRDHQGAKIRLSIISLLSVLGLSASAAHAEDLSSQGLQLHGFMDVGYYQGSNGQPDQAYSQGFRTNGLDLYFAPDFGNRVRAIAEVNIDPDFGARGSAIGIDYERMQLGYVFSQYLTVWMGRFHTPMGAYIIQSHHGAHLQTAVYKPKFIDFEDKYGVMPVHTTGLWATGNILHDDDRFNYQFYVGNGSSIDDGAQRLDMNVLHSQTKRNSFGTRLTYFWGNGLQLGASYLNSDINHFNGNPNNEINRMNVFALHGVYDAKGFEFMNEVYGFRNTRGDLSNSPTYGSFAGFSQLAYALNDEFTPYVRYERANFNLADTYFSSQINGAPYSRGALGLRYNLTEKAALKTELLRTEVSQTSGQLVKGGYNEIAVQYAIRF